MRGQRSVEHVFGYADRIWRRVGPYNDESGVVHQGYSAETGLGAVQAKPTPLDAGFQVVCNKEDYVTQDPFGYHNAMWIASTSRPDMLSITHLWSWRSVIRTRIGNMKWLWNMWCGICQKNLKLSGWKVAVGRLRWCRLGRWRQPPTFIHRICFLLVRRSISSKSEKQNSVALSKTETEYTALSSAVKEALHLRCLIIEIVVEGRIPQQSFMGTILLPRNPFYHARSEHIDIRYHFIREVV